MRPRFAASSSRNTWGQRASRSGESYGRSSSLPESTEDLAPPVSGGPNPFSRGPVSGTARLGAWKSRVLEGTIRRLGGRGLLLPSVVAGGLFFLVPLALLLLYSFGSVNLINYQVYFGWTFSNYTSIIRSIYVHVMLRSLGALARRHPRVPAHRVPRRLHHRTSQGTSPGGAAGDDDVALLCH